MRRVRAVGVVVILLAASLTVVLAGPAAGTTLSVANEAEYRDAVTTLSSDSSEPHIIEITADITLDDGTDPTYTGTEPLTLAGNGHTIDAGGTSRVLHQDTTAALTVQDLTVTGGASNLGGGIFAEGDLTLTDATVSGNTSSLNGGGIITDGDATLTNSTVSGNTADVAGGGIGVTGAATFTNSTVSGNTASLGGGIVSFGDLMLVYATVAGNTAAGGANLTLVQMGTSNTLMAFGAVVALPLGGGANCDLGAGSTTSNGFNFSDDSSCDFTGTGDRQDAGDPGLGALADNGGPTQTRLPVTGSPLIDWIPETECQADGATGIADDQRGEPRPADANADGTLACDVGAVEVQPEPPAPAEVPAPVIVVPTFTG